jgi:type IV secretion system protein VirB4
MASPKKSGRTVLERVTKKRQDRDLQAMRDISDDVLESDFVPYACLVSPNTIATKDGEILQTIKITGLGFAQTGNELRAAIRRAINDVIPDASYGIWLHTLRRQQTRHAKVRFPDAFSGQLDEAWQAGQPQSASFINELYISIVKAPQPLAIWSLKGFLKTIIPSVTNNKTLAEMDEMNRALTYVTDEMLTLLAPFGARRLEVVEREGVFYSEQMEFLEKLINLEERPMEVPERDLSHVLTSGEITFGFNSMEVRTAEGHRRFAAIMTLKEYKESTLAGIDKFLEIPCEVIVSQCFGFVGADEAREAYTKQAEILSMSGDQELAQWMEINRLTTSEGVSYGQEQTTLFLIAPSVKQLENNVKMVRRALSRLGMVIPREDLRFEECYWAQLPGNFQFVARTSAVDTAHIAGFANLQPAPIGAATGSPWGPPVSLMTTLQDTPYSFNFHRGNSAHTVILGKAGSGRTTLTHFLLAQSRKLPVRIWYVDTHRRAGDFIKAMGGSYVTPGTAALKFNPFHLPETPANMDFLALWISTLIDPHGKQLNHSSLAFFKSLVTEIMQMPRASRRLSSLLPLMRAADPLLGAALEPFCAGGKHGSLFDMPEDNFTTENLIGWDIRAWMGADETRIPLTGYLMHRLTAAVDGQATLLVLDEGFHILSTPLFAARSLKWCDYLSEKNTGCIFTTDSIAASGALSFTPGIVERAATLFALPDPEPDDEYAIGFGLSGEEMATLAYIDPNKHQVLQKRGEESLILNMQMDRLKPAMRDTLSGTVKKETLSPADQLAALMGLGARAV